MTRIFVAMESRLLVVEGDRSPPKVAVKLAGTSPQCVATDPSQPEIAYCGTFDQGLWRSEDSGVSWTRLAALEANAVTAVAVSGLEPKGSQGLVYAGTEPSAIFHSGDGGESWTRMEGLNRLPSSAGWSFPPRPQTHHVRWIGLDPTSPGRIYVAIEAGALVQSPDGGRTWIDRVDGSPFDTHTLATHRLAEGRLYSAAGDGYFESLDHGASWQSPEDGLGHHYLHGLAVDPARPDTVVVSAAAGPWRAHSPSQAQSVIYRKREGGGWERIRSGLPEAEGTIISSIAADGSPSGRFYLANNRGIFSSADGGLGWEKLDLQWPKECRDEHAWGIAVSGID